MDRVTRSRKFLRWGLAALASLFVAGGFWTWAHVRFSPDRLWDEAQFALRAGNPRKAASNLAWIYRLRVPTPRDRMLEAQIAISDGQADRALTALGSIPRNDPLAAQASLLGGRLERQRKRLRSAEAQFRRALEADPALIDARRELIYIYGIQSRRRELDAEFRHLARQVNLNHHDLYTWAFTQFAPFRPDDAKVLRTFVEAEPEDRHSRLALAEIILSEGGSQAELDRLLVGLPDDDPDVLATRAKIALTQGRLDEAATLLDRGPMEHVELNRSRGKLAVYRHDNRAAAEYYRKAQEGQPSDRIVTLELGQALSLNGEQKAAAVYLERAKHLNEVYGLINRVRSSERENESSDLIKIAKAFALAGLYEQARHWFELAVTRDPLDREAQIGLSRIRRLESEHGAKCKPRALQKTPSGHLIVA